MLPNLDRFSRPGPREKYPLLRIVSLKPECEVCGKTADPKFLRNWNEKQVCTHCINDLSQDHN